MREFEGNANINKKPQQPEREKIEPVTKNVVVKKDSEFKKFKRNFFAEDARTVKGQVFSTVIIPGIQRLITEMVKTGIDILVYGGRTRDSRDSRGASNISYSSYYDRNRGTPEYNKIPPAAYNKNVYDVNDVVIFDRGEAEKLLYRLQDEIARYGMVSVGDFYDMIGQNAPHTAQKYGWRDLSNVTVLRVREGYTLDLPKAIPLD